jgi:hypothetical protein
MEGEAMTYHGHVENGKIVLAGDVTLPEGTQVHVEVARSPESSREKVAVDALAQDQDRPIEEQIEAIWADLPREDWARIPSDLSSQLDHYIYGTPQE